jgi:RNAse (barnase) inhibitor barstar
MKTISLDGSRWKNANDFYDAFFDAVGAPSWHGRNFNALRDSIITGQINEVEIPYAIRISGCAGMTTDVRKLVEDFCELIAKFRREGYEVDATCNE